MTVTIYEGDCREYIPKVKADLIIMDPPYDIKSNRGGGLGICGRSSTPDSMPFQKVFQMPSSRIVCP